MSIAIVVYSQANALYFVVDPCQRDTLYYSTIQSVRAVNTAFEPVSPTHGPSEGVARLDARAKWL